MRAEDIVIRVDGAEPVSVAAVEEVCAACDRAEDSGGRARVVVHVSGAPAQAWSDGLTVALVSRWERALRRLERLPTTTVAVADGDCGGAALEALLATDYRVATTSVRLMVSVEAEATWPGMALYRLAQQGANAAVRRAILFGEPIPARDAQALHLVDAVTDDVVSALAAADGLHRAFSGPELAVRRQLMLDAGTVTFEEALGVHLAACDRALRRVSAGAAS